MVTGYENRYFTRVPWSRPVTLFLNEGETMEGKGQDLSLGGLSVTLNNPIALDTECIVQFTNDNGNIVEVKGIVARAERDDAGINLTGIKKDDFEEFREEIISNAQDAHAVDMEILSNFEHSPDLY